jgi:hypothetical protein
MTICVKDFSCAPAFEKPDGNLKAESLPDFTFTRFTPEQEELWSKERGELKRRTTKAQWREIGPIRNGFGGTVGHIYAMNDPGPWLAETLRMDLKSQGAKIVEASQSDSADIVISGVIQSCWLDMYFAIGSHLVVDLELRTRNQGASHVLLYAGGGSFNASGTSRELHKVLREGRQKLSWLVTREIQKHQK